MTVVRLTTYTLPGLFPTLRFLAEAWWTCPSTPKHTWRTRSDLLVATGEAYSVIPHDMRRQLDPVIRPVPRARGNTPTWLGLPCTFGRTSVWLPDDTAPSGYRELSLLALLPKHDIPELPPYVLLGAQFFLEHGARLDLDSSAAGPAGTMVIP